MMVLVAAGTCVVALLLLVDLVLGGRQLRYLRDCQEADSGPRVSVIIAARDEAAGIETALASVLQQRYANSEVIVVDDRSTDGTGSILDRVAAQSSRIRVCHIEELPPGWLGKNNGLSHGATIATGDILLFTDADVVFDPTVIGRAVRLMESDRLDHLTIAPELDSPTLPLTLVVNFFGLWLSLLFRPWRVRHAKSRAFMGIGAFNAIRASTYRAIGGHSRIAMRPDDDIKLGKLVKRSGARQQVALGMGLLSVRWYSTLGDMVRGLRKNSFSAFEYSVPLAVAAVVGQLLLNVWPFVAVAVTIGVTRELYGIAALLLMTMYALAAYGGGSRPWLALFYPVAAAILAYIVASATTRTVLRGGIEWRSTFYPLSALRQNVV